MIFYSIKINKIILYGVTSKTRTYTGQILSLLSPAYWTMVTYIGDLPLIYFYIDMEGGWL